MTLRTFAVIRHGREVDLVYFVGPEYTVDTVKDYLLREGKEPPPFEVKLIKEKTI